jgi:hypothetical protein
MSTKSVFAGSHHYVHSLLSKQAVALYLGSDVRVVVVQNASDLALAQRASSLTCRTRSSKLPLA